MMLIQIVKKKTVQYSNQIKATHLTASLSFSFAEILKSDFSATWSTPSSSSTSLRMWYGTLFLRSLSVISSSILNPLYLKCDPENVSSHIHCSDHIQSIDPKMCPHSENSIFNVHANRPRTILKDVFQWFEVRAPQVCCSCSEALDSNGLINVPGPALLSQFVLMCILPFLIPVWSIHTLTDRILMCPYGEQSPKKRERGGVGVLQSQCWKLSH